MFKTAHILVSVIPVLALFQTAHSGSLDVRQDAVQGRAVATMNDNFRRLENDKLDKRATEKLIAETNTGMKNLIINGDMRIDQRNAGAAVTISTSAFPYSVDRFFGSASVAAVTHQRVASGITGFPYALRVTGAAGNTACEIIQRIESSNIAHADSAKITISFYAAHSAGGAVTVLLQEPTAADNYTTTNAGYSQTFTLTNALTRYVYTTTLSTSAVLGLQVRLMDTDGLGAGETLTTTGWQLELGDTATAFEYRPIGTELALCQRYYLKKTYTSAETASIGMVYDASNVRFAIPRPRMFSSPTVTMSAYSTVAVLAASSLTVVSINALTGQNADAEVSYVQIEVSGATAGRAAQLRAASGQTMTIAFASEL